MIILAWTDESSYTSSSRDACVIAAATRTHSRLIRGGDGWIAQWLDPRSCTFCRSEVDGDLEAAQRVCKQQSRCVVMVYPDDHDLLEAHKDAIKAAYKIGFSREA